MVSQFKDFSGGVLDRGEGCLVPALPCASKPWIGVGTA